MMKQKTLVLASGVFAALAVIAGGLLVVAYGFTPPDWLLRCEVAAFSGVALVCGFTAAGRALLPWLRLRPVQGVFLITLGVAALFVPPNFAVAAVVSAIGVKMLWREACRLADAERAAAELEPGGSTVRLPERSDGQAMIRDGGGVPAMPERRHRHAAEVRRR